MGVVGKVIYSLGADVANWLANFKSLIAQRPDVIVIDSIYGPAIAPAVQQAKAAGSPSSPWRHHCPTR